MSTRTLPTALDNYRLFGASGLRVSPLCLGTMTFGTDWGWGADKEESRKQFELYAGKGGNFIDTANVYTKGTSEEYVGEFVAAERERFVVATKFSFGMKEGDPNSGGNHRKNIVQALEASLRRLKMDYVDLYWLHVWEFRTPIEEVMRAIEDLSRAGKILYFGFSDTPAWKITQANGLAAQYGWLPASAIQVEYSLIERTVERELMPMARECGLATTPWSPLGAGVLTGKYNKNPQGEGEGTRVKQSESRRTERNLAIAGEVLSVASEIGRSPAQVALNWLMAQPGVTSPILGARTTEQLADNLGCLDFALDSEHLERLNEVSKIELGFPGSFVYNPNIMAGTVARAKCEGRWP